MARPSTAVRIALRAALSAARLWICGRCAGDAARDLGAQPRAAAGRAVERERAVEGGDAVGEAAQARAAVAVGAADAVVGHLDAHPAVLVTDRDLRAGRVGVLGHVLQALRGDEVGGAL